jgi:hypothetical protein
LYLFSEENYVFGEQNMIFQGGYLALLCPEACLAEDSSFLLRKVTSMGKAHVQFLFDCAMTKLGCNFSWGFPTCKSTK